MENPLQFEPVLNFSSNYEFNYEFIIASIPCFSLLIKIFLHELSLRNNQDEVLDEEAEPNETQKND